ncbi:hypothetical protein Poli38472_004872 [Pythium oligandrum]|uniref:Uncharacterized protein n=1 Tax=Pythium oligandrum TaxID=41045 RepID=A0A8K1FII9_PYTOL|nr:hypothetical protein Poli38472_004872 [Pythium oligandrum]|eukprot:TMW59803.1 hypothetical protein Poli38472_004872 [Pythium oligandrum]
MEASHQDSSESQEELLTWAESLDLSAALELEVPVDTAFSPLTAVLDPPLGVWPSPKPVESSITCNKRQRDKRARLNRREELIYLRSTVTELEGKLSQLQNGRSDDEIHDARLIQEVWEDVTKRQKEQRDEAEAENRALRELLKEQLKVAQRLEQLLVKRQNLEITSSMNGTHGLVTAQDMCGLDHETVVEIMLSEIIQMYTKVDDIMCDARFHADIPKPLRDIRLRADDETGTSIETVQSRKLPFNYLHTAEAMWKTSMSRDRDTFSWRTHTSETHTATDQILIKSTDGVFDFPRSTADFLNKVAQQRFDEPGRVILIENVVCAPRRVGDQPVNGLLMRLRGWQVIEQGPNDSTLLHTYIIAAPQVVQVVPDHRLMVGALTNFMLATIEWFLDTDLQHLENHLLRITKGPNKT